MGEPKSGQAKWRECVCVVVGGLEDVSRDFWKREVYEKPAPTSCVIK